MLVQFTKLKCDRCGTISSDHDAQHVRDAWEEFRLSGSSPVRDLCPHCTISLNQWFSAVAPKEEAAPHDKL